MVYTITTVNTEFYSKFNFVRPRPVSRNTPAGLMVDHVLVRTGVRTCVSDFISWSEIPKSQNLYLSHGEPDDH